MRLSHTSAFVLLLLGQEIYKTPLARDFLSRLDLSAGQALFDQVMAYWPHYDQIIKNRKYAVLKLVETLLLEGRLPHQIIIAAAGMDAMGLEIISRHPGTRIYELDQAFMTEKEKLVPHERMHYITSDLTRHQTCLAALAEMGWQASQPSLVIYEGISYYISKQELQSLNKALAPDYVIIDYLKPLSRLNDIAVRRGNFIFDAILGDGQSLEISRYDMRKLEKTLSLPRHTRMGMVRLEKERNSRNRLFPTEAHGWIEIGLFGPAG